MNDQPAQKIIVLADNDQFITHAYKTGLENAGYVVIVATNGEEALNQIRALRPNLVLLELMLPVVDGFSVLKSVKEDPTVSDIPVMVLTNLSQPTDEAEARAAGAVEFLVKSDVSLNDVLVCIDRQLAK